MTVRRKLLFACLYLSEGAPIGFLWLALPTLLRASGVTIEEITWLTAVLVLPWTFKFAWAPLIDLLRSARWTLKHWIVTTQVLMGLTLLPLLWLDPTAEFQLLAMFLTLHATAAATQDVAIDALCISVTSPMERGAINGWMQTGMLLGRALLGGGALVVAPYIGEQAVVVGLIGVTTFSLVLVVTADLSRSEPRFDDAIPSTDDSDSRYSAAARGKVDRFEPHVQHLTNQQDAASTTAGTPASPGTPSPRLSAEVGRLGEVLQSVRQVMSERNTWIGLLFALTGGAAFKALEVIYGPFLIDRGFSKAEVGSFAALPMIGLMIAGSLTGGMLSDRLGRRRLVATSLLLICVAVSGLSVCDLNLNLQRSPVLLSFLAVTAFGIGVFTSASYALFMDITNPAVAATQFSAFMGLTNGCESWSTWIAGKLIARSGYPQALLALCVVSILSLTVLPLLVPNRGGKKS